MNTPSWDLVEQRLNEQKDVALYRTTVAAMKHVLPMLRAALPHHPPFVSHVSLAFPGPQWRGVSLGWNEDDGYRVSLILADGTLKETSCVAEDQLANSIRAYLILCNDYKEPPGHPARRS